MEDMITTEFKAKIKRLGGNTIDYKYLGRLDEEIVVMDANEETAELSFGDRYTTTPTPLKVCAIGATGGFYIEKWWVADNL